jgi:hypothetical protein
MNIEETKEAIKVMQSYVDGKTLEYKRHDGVWMLTTLPCWNWNSIEYRIKPTPVLRPWTADEVPLGAWMRSKSVQYDRWIIVHLQYSSRNREEWLNNYEHSTDGGKTWLPCGVVEEVK